MFINGFQPSSNLNVSSASIGEEGGQIATSYVVGEEGGSSQYTTLAIGEEGGGFTSVPVGEEGGDAGVNQNTSDYVDFLRAADGGGIFGDGKLTRDEIDKQLARDTKGLDFINEFGSIFKLFGYNLDPYKKAIEKQMQVGQRLKDNFAGVSNAIRDPDSITVQEIYRAAGRDGNPSNLSDFDLLYDRFIAFQSQQQPTLSNG